MERGKPTGSLSSQMKKKATNKTEKTNEYDGNFGTIISTGSTLLDLAISGGRVRGGGIPGGILVEVFGPSGSGKTVILSEIAGSIQRCGGTVMFHDPEARLNQQFAKIFGLTLDPDNYYQSNTIPDVFKAVRSWEPETKKGQIHGIMADSLAALSTDMEMDKDEGDKMGMRRAKEFSEELRKTARIITDKNYLMVCSNQIRINVDAGPYGQKYTTPGGEAVGFYASLRLRFNRAEKIKLKKKIAGKEDTRVIGVETLIEVYKSSIWKPHRTAPVTILFDYGIDDIRQNLQFIKDYTTNKVYSCRGDVLSNSMEESIKMIEDSEGYAEILRQEVIDL
jgi:recombination protein RecA